MIRAVLFGTFVLFCTNAVGQDDKTVFLLGSGSKSCGQYISDTFGTAPGRGLSVNRNGVLYYDEATVDAQWIQGFLSGLNFADGTKKPIGLDFSATDLFVRNYCNTHPTAYLVGAVFALARLQWGEGKDDRR